VAYSFYCFSSDGPEIPNAGKLEGWEHSSANEITEFTREFDQRTKLVIKNDQESAYVGVGGLRTNSKKHRVAFGKLKLTG